MKKVHKIIALNYSLGLKSGPFGNAMIILKADFTTYITWFGGFSNLSLTNLLAWWSSETVQCTVTVKLGWCVKFCAFFFSRGSATRNEFGSETLILGEKQCTK
jgi:hypothetical protein